MTELDKLQHELTDKIRELQKNCPHKQRTGWQKLYWAPGHATRFEVKICKRCGKILRRRTWCDACSKPVPENKIVRGDGKTTPINGCFCSTKCRDEYAEKTGFKGKQ